MFQLVSALVLIFATLTPLINCFDSWDKNQPPINDTELQVTALFIGAGFVLVLPKLVRHLRVPVVRLQQSAQPSFRCVALLSCESLGPEPSVSPPLLPLRI